jgi:hypothetical protein
MRVATNISKFLAIVSALWVVQWAGIVGLTRLGGKLPTDPHHSPMFEVERQRERFLRRTWRPTIALSLVCTVLWLVLTIIDG